MKKWKLTRGESAFVYGLPVLHILLCALVALNIVSIWGSWTSFLVFYVDFPFSIIIMVLMGGTPSMLAYAVLGTLWWYCLGMLILMVVKTTKNFVSRARSGKGTGQN